LLSNTETTGLKTKVKNIIIITVIIIHSINIKTTVTVCVVSRVMCNNDKLT